MSGHADVVLEAGRLKLTFHWKDDRYQHRVSAGGKTRRSTAEGPLGRPVFTEIHRQGDVLFLSGHGDACHWSASVQAEESAVAFDIACRASRDVGEIGSGYEGNGLFVEPFGDAATRVLPGPEEVRDCPAWSITPGEPWGVFPCTRRYAYRIRVSD